MAELFPGRGWEDLKYSRSTRSLEMMFFMAQTMEMVTHKCQKMRLKLREIDAGSNASGTSLQSPSLPTLPSPEM